VYLRLSRSHPKFLINLFEAEVPELASGSLEVKGLAREAGSRTKIAITSIDPHVDPVGALVGQRGVRVSTVMGELGGERIDIIEWSDDQVNYIKESLNPATVIDVELNDADHRAKVTVSEDQQSLAIGRGGQNVRLAAKLTGWNIDIESTGGSNVGGSENDEITFDSKASDESVTAAEADLEAQEIAVEEAPSVEVGMGSNESDSIITSEEEASENTGSLTVEDQVDLNDSGTPEDSDDRDAAADTADKS
jgi:N utilization substance protein A